MTRLLRNKERDMHYLGLDIGGTKIAAVVMDAHGWEIRRYRCPT